MSTAKNFIRADIQASSAYPVPDSTGMLKLDAMENPFGFPSHLQGELAQRLSQVALNRYPDPRYSELRELLRQRYEICSNAPIMLGNGSDELIDLLAKAVAKEGASILAPEPGFVMYRASAMQARVQYIAVPLQAHDFSLDMPAMLSAIERHNPAVIYLAYPNNPTGNCYSVENIETILRVAPGLVVLDEAYQPFAADSWMPRLAEFTNMIVMRTVSKWGLAGIRLGYMAGASAWMEQLEKIRPPYNVNVLTQATAQFCLEHLEQFSEQTQVLRAERSRLLAGLKQLTCVHPFESSANFVLSRFADAAGVFNQLKADRILVKNVSAMHPNLQNCLRITVGLSEQNDQVLSSIRRALKT
jgi:histidinol-phosphate aminotransferase